MDQQADGEKNMIYKQTDEEPRQADRRKKRDRQEDELIGRQADERRQTETLQMVEILIMLNCLINVT